jgi:putative endonuclease
MEDQRKSLGDFGERLAAMSLLRGGYHIRGTQVRTPFGEIDIIAERGGALLFVEVKTRKTEQFGSPEESITAEKRLHLARAVEHYRGSEKLLDRPFQVDAITVLMDQKTKKATLRRIEHILEE